MEPWMSSTEVKTPENGTVTEALGNLKKVADEVQADQVEATKMQPEPEVVKISDGERALLDDAQSAVIEAERVLGAARARFIRQERELETEIDVRRSDAVTLLEFISRRHLKDAEGHWDFWPTAGGFIRTKE